MSHDCDEVLVEALSAGMSHAMAAVMAGVSTKTVQRRLHDPVFANLVRQRRALRVEEITGRLSEMAVRAVDAIEGCLNSGSGTTRLKAAEMILSWLSRLRDEVDVDVRLAAFEARGLPVAGADLSEDGEQ